MWRHLAIFLTFYCFKVTVQQEDTSDICYGIRDGDVISNPFDCRSYYVCANTPILSYCDDELLFDAELKICNWPANVRCPDTASQSMTTATIDYSTNTTPDFSWWEDKPLPLFKAVDTETFETIDPLEKYDPEHVACRHYGAYFLPHPRNCRKYYLCAYGHLHEHQCGRGINWNYKHQQCEQSGEALCYGNVDDESNEHGGIVTTHIMDTTASLPSTTSVYQSTICYPVTTGGTGGTSGSTWHPTGTYTPTESTAVFSTEEIASTDNNMLACPSIDQQGYLPHPTNCSRYYICIVGMPVLTSCPDGLYWDQNAEFCDLAENVNCSTQDLEE